jgi:outer membrane protein assembly factor BamA
MQIAPGRPIRAPRPLRAGFGAALVLLGACFGNRGPTGPFPGLEPYAGREVRKVRLEGEELQLPADSVRRVIATRGSSCKLLGVLPICPFGRGRVKRLLDLNVLARDVVRVQLLYRDNGYYGTRVVPDVQEVPGNKVDVRFRITPGDLVRLVELDVQGTAGILDSAVLNRRIPLKVGDPFRRIDFLASVDTVRNALLERGHAYAQVLRNFDIDTIADQARVELVASPGPMVTVDTVVVAGNYRLSEKTVRQQLTFREGSPLRASDLSRSQRNLFDLELVDFAAVEVAAESLQVTPDSAQLLEDSIGSTVLARLTEAPRYAVDASVGYASQECFRGRASHTDRNFLGGARRLEVSGLVSRVGAAEPLEMGLERDLCRAAAGPEELESGLDSIQSRIAEALNYRVAVDFVQPRLFGTRTSFVAGGYYEQLSEPGLYLRRSRGGQVGAVRQIARGAVLTGTVSAQRGNTVAPDIFYCLALEVCSPEQIERRQESRWTNTVSLGLLSNRVRLNPFPESGFQLRSEVDVASQVIGSDDRFARLYVDGILFREIKEGYVVSGRVAAGTFLEGLLDPEDFIPPEQRFYGGGPSHVRGFARNRLGPAVYLQQQIITKADTLGTKEIASATGGTRTVLGSLEVTTPSPFLRQNLRLAFFVDAGQVWDSPDRGDVTSPGIRVTPGFGARIATPVGPMRLDIGYDPYPRERGPLYSVDLDGNISDQPIQLEYRPADERNFLQRLVFQFGIGYGL